MLDIRMLAPAPSVRLIAVTAGFSAFTAIVRESRLALRGGVSSVVTAKCPDTSVSRNGFRLR